nr:GNAT family N-acetyltransferase [Rhodoligotrophos appendicifer]
MQDVRDNAEKSRFELAVDGDIVFANYRRSGSSVVITHVEAPPKLRGTGAADRLMRGIVKEVDAQGLEIVPLCGYAAAWLRRRGRPSGR